VTALAHVGETEIDDGSPPLDRSHQAFEHSRSSVECDSLPLRSGTLLGVALEAFVEFGETGGERRASFVEAGSPDPDVGAQRTNHRSPLLDLGAGDGESATGFERGFLGRLELGQLCLEFVDPDRLAFESRGEFVEASLQRVGLGRDLTSIGIGALQGVGRRTQPLLNAGEPLGELIGPNRTLGKLASSLGGGIGGSGTDRSSALDLRFGFSERCTRGTRAGRTDAPTLGTEPVAGTGHDDLTGASERLIERSLPVAVDGDRIGEQHVEQIIDRRGCARDVAPHELGAFSPSASSAAEGEDGAGCVARGEFGECESGGVGALDDHGREGVAGSGLEGGFPARLDGNEVEKRAKDTLDGGEALSPTASAGLVERKGQRLGAGDPTMMIGLGVDLFGLAGGDVLLRNLTGGGGRLVGRDKRLLFVVEGPEVGSPPGCVRFEILTLLFELSELGLKEG
jgi:hypothetical protein